MNQVKTIYDTIKASYNLASMGCLHCKHEGEVTYHQYIKDAYCAWCGEWQLEKEIKEVSPSHV